MTCVIYVNLYLHMVSSTMIIHTYFHLYNSIEIMIYKLMFIITFFIITGMKLHTLKDWHIIYSYLYTELKCISYTISAYFMVYYRQTLWYINLSLLNIFLLIHGTTCHIENKWDLTYYQQNHCTRTSCDHSSQAFIVYAYAHVKYLHSLLSSIACLDDEVKVYV